MVMTSPADCPVNVIVGVLSLVMSSVEDEPESDAARRSGANDCGPVASIVNGRALDTRDVFPAGSVRVAVTFQAPSIRDGNVQFVAEPTTYVHETVVVPFVAEIVMVSPFTPPVAPRVGVVSLVLLSVDEEPVSEAVTRSTEVGAVGRDVSMVTERAVDADDAPLVG
jgi:hypothetical protein